MKLHNRELLNFLLFNVLKTKNLTESSFFEEHTEETFSFALDMTEQLAEKYLQPFLADSDRKIPHFKDGSLIVHDALPAFVKAAAETGLPGATLPFEYGGQQLPKTVNGAMEYIQMTAHNSFVMYTDLISGCASLIATFASEELKTRFLPIMLKGKWLGTMCLTEPQAGSSLSDIKTTAKPLENGNYSIEGQKIFISAGDHNLSENIINLVLARIEGAPEGTKGISLFIVPKYKLGSFEPNGIESIAAIHKMGQKATPAMHLGFGASSLCEGFLLGEANKGLLYMFQMMNAARLGVGLTGISIASAAYYHSLQYAKERVQGKALLGSKNSVKIIEHADVRRMLLMQKAIYEGGLGLMLQCYQYLDFEKTKPEEAKKYHALAELLTPVAKSFGAEMGIEATNLGLQVLGGYGYTEDFVLEQLARDVRICSIYEGTTGIHSLAILGREIFGSDALVLEDWKSEIQTTLDLAQKHASLMVLAEKLEAEVYELIEISSLLLDNFKNGKVQKSLADSVLFIEYFGLVTVAWIWLKMAEAAEADKATLDVNFVDSQLHTARFYFEYILSRTQGLKTTLKNMSGLTTFDTEKEILI
jgi:alkylation response protein AidB-like acyl-CoA dehydrogenase